jgi:hypothetical protein
MEGRRRGASAGYGGKAVEVYGNIRTTERLILSLELPLKRSPSSIPFYFHSIFLAFHLSFAVINDLDHSIIF